MSEVAVRHRRAFGLVLASAVLPGAAQYLAGNRELGGVVVKATATAYGAVLATVLGLLLFRGPTLGFLLHGGVALTLKIVVWVAFAGWLVLLVDAWRLSQPANLPRRSRLWLTGLCLMLAALVATITAVAANAFTAAGHLSTVLQGGGETKPQAGRFNILLLGVDAAADREGIRPDSITVASIDEATGRTVLFGLPRNLMGVQFPKDSPLRQLYPEGFRCGGECMLNGVYQLGQDHPEYYPGKEAGLEATREAVEETLGIKLNYYAMVDIAGFQSLIDALGGIRLDIGKRVPIGGGSSEIYGYIEPGEGVQLDGYHALWFARSRAGSDDYERMVRQKCVMAAMAKQLDPLTVATKFVDLAEAGSHVMRTDIGPAEINSLAELALKAKELPIETVNMAPPLIETAHPDFAVIREAVLDGIARSQALDSGSAAPSSSQAIPAATQPAETQAAESQAAQTPSASQTTIAEAPVCRVS